MLKDIIENAVSVDRVKIIDTDSLFIKLPVNYSREFVEQIESDINKAMVSFMDRHHLNYTDFVRMRLKSEFYVRRMVTYTIKRYIACTVDPATGNVDVEMRGVEGRRAAQGYVVDLVNHIIEYLRLGRYEENIDLRGIIWDIVRKIEEAAMNYDFNYLGNPINPPKDFNDLKAIGSHIRGMIFYNVLVDDFFGKNVSKGLHMPVYIDPSEIRNNYQLREICSQVIGKWSKYPAIKIRRRKKDTDEEFYSNLIRDITVPEIVSPSFYVHKLQAYGIRANVGEIITKFAKKFNILCFPFYSSCDFDFIGEFESVFRYLDAKYI